MSGSPRAVVEMQPRQLTLERALAAGREHAKQVLAGVIVGHQLRIHELDQRTVAGLLSQPMYALWRGIVEQIKAGDAVDPIAACQIADNPSAAQHAFSMLDLVGAFPSAGQTAFAALQALEQQLTGLRILDDLRADILVGDGAESMQRLRDWERSRANGSDSELTTESACELLDRPSENVPQIVQGYIARSEATIMGADAGAGKTILALETAICVATGHPVGGLIPVEGPSPVLFVEVDQSATLTSNRLRRQLAGHRLSPRDARDMPLRFVTDPLCNLSDARQRSAFFRLVEREKPALIVFDSLIRIAIGVDLKKSEEFAPWYASTIVPLLDLGAAVLILHHARKPQGSDAKAGHLQHKVRDSSDIVAAVSCVTILERDPTGDGRVMHCTKCRWAEEPKPLSLVYEGGKSEPLRVVAIGPAGDHESVILNLLTDAGASGLSRALLVEELIGRGLGADSAQKATTRTLARLEAAGRVVTQSKGKTKIAWLRDLAPNELIRAHAVLRGEGSR